jgi:hypothetical protein
MADAPAGGGGLSGAEIVLLVILGLGALAVFNGTPFKTVAPAGSGTHTVTTTKNTTGTTVSACDIVLTRPVALEQVSQVVTVTGTIANCNPSMLAGQVSSLQSIVLNIQIVDSNGTPMSAYTPIALSAITSNNSGSFYTNIALNGAPAAGTGYVIVIGPRQNDGALFTARVPIRFR